MRTIRTKVYTFDELSEKVQNKVIENLSGINVENDWWDTEYEDAREIGLKITSFDLDRNRNAKGKFIISAGEVVEAILENHGAMCETYKTAMKYKNYFQSTSNEVNEEELEESEDNFLKEILEDYSIMLQDQYEYLQSDEAIKETIECNEYEFTADGRRV